MLWWSLPHINMNQSNYIYIIYMIYIISYILYIYYIYNYTYISPFPFGGFPGGASGKEPACQCRRHKRRGFDPLVEKMPWRRKWHPAPVFLPGESHGQRILVGYSPWGRTELDTTKVTAQHSTPSWAPPAFHLSRSSHSTGLSSLCYTAAYCWLSILRMLVYLYLCYFFNF